MVGYIEGTVGYDEETVAFNKAVLFVKKKYRLFYKDISAQIGLDEKQGEQIRAGKRRAANIDIGRLIGLYPEVTKFFPRYEKEVYTTSEHLENPPVTQTLNEPMGAHFYGKKPEPWQELVETQKKLIAKLEMELAAVTERLKVVEAERKTLIDIVSQRK